MFTRIGDDTRMSRDSNPTSQSITSILAEGAGGERGQSQRHGARAIPIVRNRYSVSLQEETIALASDLLRVGLRERSVRLVLRDIRPDIKRRTIYNLVKRAGKKAFDQQVCYYDNSAAGITGFHG
jgi:hypothetical protein